MNFAHGIEEFINRCNNAMPPDFYKFSVAEQRELYLGLTREFPYELPSGVEICDEEVGIADRRLAFRVYKPLETSGDGLLIYIRGGGFVVGSLETHNTVAAELSAKSGLVTIAPDFRMSPENPFPAALEDCYSILCWVAREAARFDVDPRKIVVCGDSSGANMAVVLCMMCRDRGGPLLRGQALISPVLDFTRWRHGGHDAPLLTSGEMEYYTACYVPDAELTGHPYISPLLAGSFEGLPPAYIMGAEMDSLLVDSERYAESLKSCSIPAEIVVEKGLVHSAVRARGLSVQVAKAWDRFCLKACHLALEG